MRTRITLIFSIAVLALGASGCSDGSASPTPGGLTWTTAALGANCELPNGDKYFPQGASKVVLEVTGGAIEGSMVQAFEQLDADGRAVIDEIPPGTGMNVTVVACDQEDGTASWAGVSESLEISEIGFEANVDVFLTRKDTLGRTGRCSDTGEEFATLSAGHAFAAVDTFGDRMWVLGGFDEMVIGTDVELQAGATVEVYDRTASMFTTAGSLAEPRAMALVQALDNGQMRLIGGVSTVKMAVLGLPNLAAQTAPSHGIEYFDTTTQTSGTQVQTGFMPLPSVAGLSDGRAVVVGGGDLSTNPPSYSSQAWIVPAGEVVAADLRAVDMGSDRYGATVIPTANGVLIWGGAVGNVDAPTGLWIDPDPLAEPLIALQGADDEPQTMFGAGAYIGEEDGTHRFVVLGGSEIDSDGSFQLAVNGQYGVRVDVNTNTDPWSVTTAELDFGDDAGQLQRAGASLTRLGDGSLWFVGGYQAFGPGTGPCGETGDFCLPPQTLRFRLDGADPVAHPVGTSHELSWTDSWQVGPFGIAVAQQVDGSWLMVPGFGSVPPLPTQDAGLARFQFTAAEEALCSTSVDGGTAL